MTGAPRSTLPWQVPAVTDDREPLPLYSSEEDIEAGKPVAYAYWDEATKSWTTPPIGAARPEPNQPAMIRCPACNHWEAEEDFDAQRVHLLANHPGLISRRLQEHKRWDGWVND
jgi:hypothetical protein